MPIRSLALQNCERVEAAEVAVVVWVILFVVLEVRQY